MRTVAPLAFLAFFTIAAACGTSSSSPSPTDSDAGIDDNDAGSVVDEDSGSTDDASASNFCSKCAASPGLGKIANPAIKEASGFAASKVHADRFYVENDSGDTARFFAIDKSGADFGTFDVTGATADDWEDIAVGPCPAGSCVYLGDHGDNAMKRTSYTVYRVTEPTTLAAGTHSVAAEAFPFTYPDGSHNCETLLVHPVTGVITVVTKIAGTPSGIYEFPMPLTPGVSATLIKRGTISAVGTSPLFTGGDVGSRGILLRTYSSVLFYPLASGQTVYDALKATPCVAPTPNEGQGEAVGWFSDGSGYGTVSEGVAVPVNLFACSN